MENAVTRGSGKSVVAQQLVNQLLLAGKRVVVVGASGQRVLQQHKHLVSITSTPLGASDELVVTEETTDARR